MPRTREIDGCEFGAPSPKVIYVGLRWNGKPFTRKRRDALLKLLSKQLGNHRGRHHLTVAPSEIRVYNLLAPKAGQGMTVKPCELPEVGRTLDRIAAFVRRSKAVERIIVGGLSGPMPMAWLMLRWMLPNKTRRVAVPPSGSPTNGTQAPHHRRGDGPV